MGWGGMERGGEEWYVVGRDVMERNGKGRDGMGRGEMGLDGMEWDGMGLKEMEWDGTGPGGFGWDGTRWDGIGWNGVGACRYDVDHDLVQRFSVRSAPQASQCTA